MTDRKKHLKMKQFKCFCPTQACTTPLIPFLTQPLHERTLTGWGSRVYPNGQGSLVRPGWGRRCARASPLAAHAANFQLAQRTCGGVLGLCPLRLALREPSESTVLLVGAYCRNSRTEKSRFLHQINQTGNCST